MMVITQTFWAFGRIKGYSGFGGNWIGWDYWPFGKFWGKNSGFHQVGKVKFREGNFPTRGFQLFLFFPILGGILIGWLEGWPLIKGEFRFLRTLN